jgi:hypothetical protein
VYFRSIEIQIHALAYSIVDPEQYLRETIHVPGGVFGQEFASTEAKKKQMFPVVVVSWDRNAKCSDHRGADLHGVVTVQDLYPALLVSELCVEGTDDGYQCAVAETSLLARHHE